MTNANTAPAESAGAMFKRTKRLQPTAPPNRMPIQPQETSSNPETTPDDESANNNKRPFQIKRSLLQQHDDNKQSSCLSHRRTILLPFKAGDTNNIGAIHYCKASGAASQPGDLHFSSSSPPEDWRAVDLGKGRLFTIQHHLLTNAQPNSTACLQRGFSATCRNFEIQGAMDPDGPVTLYGCSASVLAIVLPLYSLLATVIQLVGCYTALMLRTLRSG